MRKGNRKDRDGTSSLASPGAHRCRKISAASRGSSIHYHRHPSLLTGIEHLATNVRMMCGVSVCVEIGGVVGRERRLVEGTSGEKDGQREKKNSSSTVPL